MSSVTRQLVQACADGDVDAAVRAIAAGADVNGTARASHWAWAVSPLVAAISNHHHAVVVALLSHGADANRDTVMHASVDFGAARTLQVLIDAGGNPATRRDPSTHPPLFHAVAGGRCDNVRVLLARHSDLCVVAYAGITLPQFARQFGFPGIADEIDREVRNFIHARVGCVSAMQRD